MAEEYAAYAPLEALTSVMASFPHIHLTLLVNSQALLDPGAAIPAAQ